MADQETIAERIRNDLQVFTPTERKAAHVLLANYPIAGLETVAEFARRANVSAPTILRFVARLGFSGYPDFQRSLRDELDKQSQSPLMKAGYQSAVDAAERSPFNVFRDALIENIRETFDRVPTSEFDAVVKLLGDARRPVHTVGGRFSDALAAHTAAHLRVVRPGVTHVSGQTSNWRDMLLDMGARDVLVIFDIRRYQEDLAFFAQAAAERGVTIILVTDQWLSPVARHARHVLAARVPVPSRWDSMVALLGLMEAVIAAVTEVMGETTVRRIALIDALRS
ncbi:DNA-binding transcriptional repressor RpiR [Hartmannibacter diazotrophicus]|uniref:DNA-binding transcriptional repressor RpiR n=1 Tax=Hartmannibacter diazotrophicus TaxID=1482074 RepID=A0A2C9D8D4_9HYPH|nr:MurR/RpiR family transcriptional regulator [Hartmannibacter diazotrophicus]SON56567.1 DNA-binding transcriptional repressor RpiR [Hartmannibacter diazotrophicus]